MNSVVEIESPNDLRPAESAMPKGSMACHWGNPLDEADWDARVMRCGSYCFFHGASWLRVLQESYGFKPMYLACSDHSAPGALMPLMEVRDIFTGTRGVSLPFSDCCEPLVSESVPSVHLFREIVHFGRSRRWKFYQCRGGTLPLNEAQPSLAFYEHRLDLRHSTKDLFAGFHGSVRQAVRKAEREGVKVEISAAISDLRDFYNLHCITRKRHGLPPQPFAFFLNLHRYVISRDQGWVVLARHGQQAIAGAIFLHLGKRVVYKFGASSEAFQHLRGNNLAIWEAIKWYAQNGFESLHFGRTSLANEGLRRFKGSWGSRESLLHYFKYELAKNTFVTENDGASSWYNRLFLALPVAVARLIGAMLYRHTA